MVKRASLASGVKPSKLAESMRPLAEETAPNPLILVEGTPAPSLPKEPKPVGKRYEGKKTMLIPLDPAIHRKLKIVAVQRDMTLEKIVQEAISTYISKDVE